MDTRPMEPLEQKTAVFTPGDFSPEVKFAGHHMDDATKELPLISGRFAGREWIAEDLRREVEEKPAKPRLRRRRSSLVLAGMTAFALLTGSLMGQARLAALNDQAVAVTAQTRQLRQEQNELIVTYAAHGDLGSAERYAVTTLGMQAPRPDQYVAVDAARPDKATVLGVRRGQEIRYLWGSFLDSLGAYLH